MLGEDFDWVAARVKCNVRDLFTQLRDRVKSDVRSAESNAGVKAEVEDRTPDNFIVRIPNPTIAGQSRDWRTFGLSGTVIEVRGNGDKPILEARANLDGQECKLSVQIGDRERHMRLWEFSREALEPLFFNGR